MVGYGHGGAITAWNGISPGKRRIMLIVIALIVITMITIMVWRANYITIIFTTSNNQPSSQSSQSSKCQFCDNKATMVRKPLEHKIAYRKLFDLEPSYAELQTVYCCDECKAIAGGFRTTVWHKLSNA